jgi:hypothetical protein
MLVRDMHDFGDSWTWALLASAVALFVLLLFLPYISA